jgi:GDP-mannose 6-dehydrogenase
VLDRHLSIARLRGANRRFIEQEIPHLASLLCDDPAELVRDIDVLIVGHPGPDAAAAVAAAAPEVAIVDLTRGGASRASTPVAVRAAS